MWPCFFQSLIHLKIIFWDLVQLFLRVLESGKSNKVADLDNGCINILVWSNISVQEMMCEPVPNHSVKTFLSKLNITHRYLLLTIRQELMVHSYIPQSKKIVSKAFGMFFYSPRIHPIGKTSIGKFNGFLFYAIHKDFN